MPTVIQPGFVSIPSPYGPLDTSIAQGVSEGFDLGYNRRGNEKVNKFKTVNDIIAKTFPDELGGFTAAYRSGNPQQAAAADQALGLYLNSVEGITGKRLRPEEREAIKGAFVNGQLTTKQLLANAQAQVMSPQGQGQGAPVQAPQTQNAQGPATPVAATGPLGPIANVPSQPQNLETMQPQQQQGQPGVGQVLQPPPLTPMPPQGASVPQGNRTTDAARRMAEQAVMQGKGYGSQGGGPGATVNPLQAAEPAQMQAPQGGTTINTPADRAIRKRVFEQVLKVNAAKQRGESKNPFLVGEEVKFTPEETKAFQDEVSRETPEGGRAIPTGTGSEIALDKRELTNVARAVKGTSTLMDTLLKARNADELGRKVYSVTRALETAAALVPGSKEMDREWAAGTVKAILNATPRELTALGLTEEAKNFLEDDRNRIAAEANSINLFSTLKRAAVDLTQLETSKRIAELQYLGAAAASTGTQQGILTKGLTDITVALINAGAGSAGGKPQTGAQLGKYFEQAGFKNFLDFAQGLYGGSGTELRTLGGFNLPLLGNVGGTEAYMPIAPGDLGVTGATPSAYAGQVSSGMAGGGAPTAGMNSSKTSQKSMTKASGIDQYFDQGGVQETYRRNADKMTQDWQAYMASLQ